MHPIIGTRYRLALYSVALLIAGALLAVLLASFAEVRWRVAFALAVPLTDVYGFVCLGTWYLCRAVPLTPTNRGRLAATMVGAAVLSSALWGAAAHAWAWVLGSIGTFESAPAVVTRLLPLLITLGILVFLLSAVLHYLIIETDRARRAETQALALEVHAREAELRALRAQVDPHFLFNSLHSISALTAIDPEAARRMCLLLGDFLRLSLRAGASQTITLAEELALVDQFLAIEQIRFGRRLVVERNVDEAASACLVPPLLLQPLVENAIRHGIAHLVDGGVVRLETRLSGGTLQVVVDNPCDRDRPKSRGVGLGLENVRARLDTRSGRAAGVVAEEHDGRFRVELSMPAEPAVPPADGPGAPAVHAQGVHG